VPTDSSSPAPRRIGNPDALTASGRDGGEDAAGGLQIELVAVLVGHAGVSLGVVVKGGHWTKARC
jgi:hypothetical protein